jgi:hypothetical protein
MSQVGDGTVTVLKMFRNCSARCALISLSDSRMARAEREYFAIA